MRSDRDTEEERAWRDSRYASLERSLTNQTPTTEQVGRIESIRQIGRELGHWITHETDPGREQSLALTHLEETVMWAVKAIVLEEGE